MNIEEDVQRSAVNHGKKRQVIVELLKGRGYKTGVEIGVQYGQSSELWLDNNVIDKLYGVDPYDSSIYPISPLKGLDEEIYQYVLKKMERFGERFELIRKTSNDALLDIKGLVDCIYLDGSRSKLSVYDDMSYWYTKLNDGGIMLSGDYNHVSYPWTTRLLKKYFTDVNVIDNYLWWVEKKPRPNKNKISVVTPFYNTGDYANSLIDYVLADERIDEMVIVDDCSKREEYERLLEVAGNQSKIRIYRNEENLGEFKNRIKATKLTKNNWVIFLDGDNSLTKEYVDAICNNPIWRENVIYCPTFGLNRKIDYRMFSGDYIGLNNVESYLDGEHSYHFNMFLGTGNYFMNKKAYLKTAIPIREIDKRQYGDYYFSVEWMKNNLMFFVPEMSYIHRLRPNSEWMENKHFIQRKYHKVMENFRNYKNIKLRTDYHPMMSDKEIDYIDNLIEELKPEKCLEWGSGMSTIYFPRKHNCIKFWESYEHSRKWFRRVGGYMDKSKVYLHIVDREGYLSAKGKYDLILVDGEWRNECLDLAKDMLNPGGVILLHDSARPDYDEAVAKYEHKEIVLKGEPTGDTVHRGITKLWV